MIADCINCGRESTVEAVDDIYCQCIECGQVYMIEADADFNGEGWVDCSTRGEPVLTVYKTDMPNVYRTAGGLLYLLENTNGVYIAS